MVLNSAPNVVRCDELCSSNRIVFLSTPSSPDPERPSGRKAYSGRPGWDDLPTPPRMRPRRQPRRRLTPDAIIDAAFAVLDEGGVAGMNMRAVAEQLGTGPA